MNNTFNSESFLKDFKKNKQKEIKVKLNIHHKLTHRSFGIYLFYLRAQLCRQLAVAAVKKWNNRFVYEIEIHNKLLKSLFTHVHHHQPSINSLVKKLPHFLMINDDFCLRFISSRYSKVFSLIRHIIDCDFQFFLAHAKREFNEALFGKSIKCKLYK